MQVARIIRRFCEIAFLYYKDIKSLDFWLFKLKSRLFLYLKWGKSTKSDCRFFFEKSASR